MIAQLDYLREMNLVSVLLRLLLAMLFGGLIGLERVRKRRPAGFRTYMLVCMGAALTMILSQYEFYMVTHDWAELAAEIGLRTDVSRFGAQVINGIGFLGAGTILVTGRQEVKGADHGGGPVGIGLHGVGHRRRIYECVGLGFALIFLSIRLLPFIETAVIENARNMNIMWSSNPWTMWVRSSTASSHRTFRSSRWTLSGPGRTAPAIPARCSSFG